MSNIKKFEMIYEKYVNDVYRVALYLVKDEDKAKDITQQAYTNIYKTHHKIGENKIYSQLIYTAKMLAEKSNLNKDTKEGKQ